MNKRNTQIIMQVREDDSNRPSITLVYHPKFQYR